MISNVKITYENPVWLGSNTTQSSFPGFEIIYDNGRHVTCGIFEILAYIEDMPDGLATAIIGYIEEGFPGFSAYLEDLREEPDLEVTLQESQMSLKEFIYE